MNDIWSAPITANILTGFLGSGKTSLLRRLLRQPDLSDTAVMINEFGEVGLDHLLIEAVDDDVVLLDSGCVCCTIRGDLKEALLRLYARRQRGEVPPFTPRRDRDDRARRSGADRRHVCRRSDAEAPFSRRQRRDGGRCGMRRRQSRSLRGMPQAGRGRRPAGRLQDRHRRRRDKAAQLRARLSRINSTAEIVESSEVG